MSARADARALINTLREMEEGEQDLDLYSIGRMFLDFLDEWTDMHPTDKHRVGMDWQGLGHYWGNGSR